MNSSLPVHLRTAYQQYIDDAIADLTLIDNCKPTHFKKRLLAQVKSSPDITIAPRLSIEHGIVHLTLNVDSVSGVEDSDIIGLLNEIGWTEMIESDDNYVILTDSVKLDVNRLIELINQM